VRSKGLASFKQCFQAGKNARPSVGAKRVGGISFIPLIVADGEFGSFRFRHQFGGNTGFERALPELKRILEQLGRFSLQNPAIYKGGRLAIGSRPDPLHGTARFYIRLKVGTRKDDAVRLR